MRIAVTGSRGQLGRELCRQLAGTAIPLDLPEFDITDAAEVSSILGGDSPDAVINCAAYTMVDQAEQDPETCTRVNADGVRILANWCGRNDCTLVQISTDFVFGGDFDHRIPYMESDVPAPQGVYAKTKLQGESRAAAIRRHLVIRTCGLYGFSPRNNNFVEAMLRLGSERDSLSVVDDHECTPSYVTDVANAILYLLRGGHLGIFHVTNSGSATWCEFAREIFLKSGRDVKVEPISTEQYGAPAPRPRYSVLDLAKYTAAGGPTMPDWRDALRRYLEERSSTSGEDPSR